LPVSNDVVPETQVCNPLAIYWLQITTFPYTFFSSELIYISRVCLYVCLYHRETICTSFEKQIIIPCLWSFRVCYLMGLMGIVKLTW
jgi:hypothetical protein